MLVYGVLMSVVGAVCNMIQLHALYKLHVVYMGWETVYFHKVIDNYSTIHTSSSLVPRPPHPTAKRWSGQILQDSWAGYESYSGMSEYQSDFF